MPNSVREKYFQNRFNFTVNSEVLFKRRRKEKINLKPLVREGKREHV